MTLTVAEVRKDAEACEEIPHIGPTERIDAGGRNRARKTVNKPTTPPVEEPKPAVEEPRAPEQPKVTPTEPEATPALEPQVEASTPVDVLLDTFHKLTPKEQVSAMQLFWDVLSPSQRQQIAPKHEASEDHPSAAPTMEQFEAFWESASRDLRKAVNTFVQKKAAEARARQQATMRPMTSAEQNRP